MQMTTPDLTDPRVRRTREFVLEEVRLMLRGNEAVNFSELSRRARVSRRTLYDHWGTVEALVSDSLRSLRIDYPESPAGASTEERAYSYLQNLAGQGDRSTAVALASMLASVGRDPGSASSFAHLEGEISTSFRQRVGPVTADQLLQILSPIALAILVNAEIGEELLRSLARRTAELIDA